MQKHIQLYVNDFSVDLGDKGKHAVELMMRKAKELNLIQNINSELFVG
jgi:1,4-dihydroxy-6-naphthoate synthase